MGSRILRIVYQLSRRQHRVSVFSLRDVVIIIILTGIRHCGTCEYLESFLDECIVTDQ